MVPRQRATGRSRRPEGSGGTKPFSLFGFPLRKKSVPRHQADVLVVSAHQVHALDSPPNRSSVADHFNAVLATVGVIPRKGCAVRVSRIVKPSSHFFSFQRDTTVSSERMSPCRSAIKIALSPAGITNFSVNGSNGDWGSKPPACSRKTPPLRGHPTQLLDWGHGAIGCQGERTDPVRHRPTEGGQRQQIPGRAPHPNARIGGKSLAGRPPFLEAGRLAPTEEPGRPGTGENPSHPHSTRLCLLNTSVSVTRVLRQQSVDWEGQLKAAQPTPAEVSRLLACLPARVAARPTLTPPHPAPGQPKGWTTNAPSR